MFRPFCLFKIFSILCWNLCVNCWTNIVGSCSFSIVLICSTTLFLLLYYFVCVCVLFYVIKVRVLKISITFSLENRPKPTKTKILPKPIDFQSFRSVLVENFTNRNIWFQFTIPIKTDRTEPSTPLVREHKRMIANVLSKHH